MTAPKASLVPVLHFVFSAFVRAEIGESAVFSQTAMTKIARLAALTAVLAAYTGAQADIQPRVLTTEAPIRVEFADGRKTTCRIVRWDAFGFEGSCGSVRWDEFKPATVFAMLRELVDPRDAEACCDVATIVVSLEPKGVAAKPAVDWARRAGADRARTDRIGPAAAELTKLREAKRRDDEFARLARITPEAEAFPTRPWQSLHSADVEAAGASTIEAARALLAKTGGSANLHETQHVALLLESDSEAAVKDAAFLERFFREWRGRFEEIGLGIAEQGRIPVVIVSDRDRWRLLVQTAFGGDAAAFPDAVTIYPRSGVPAESRPIVLVRPDSDPNRQRYNAVVGLSRAMLHLVGSAERPPAWINEALPKIMAELAVPEAKMDGDFRRRALAAVRSGAGFAAVLDSAYGQGAWMRDPALAQSVSYLFTRWLADRSLASVLRYAKGPRTSEGEPARFRRIFGMSAEDAVARASSWFATND